MTTTLAPIEKSSGSLDPNKVYTPAEAAVRLRIREYTVRKLIRSKQLKSYAVNGTAENPRSIRTTEAMICAYIAAQAEGGAA